MSRRSRRGKSTDEGRWVGKGILILGVLMLLSLIVAYGMLRRYLHSDAFRKFLSAEASEAAGVVGEFAPFQWDGLAVDTAAFQATGEGLVTRVRAAGLHTEVGFGGLKRGVWEIRGSSAKQLEIFLDAAKVTDQEVKADVRRKVDKKSKRPAWLPSEAELQTIEVRDLSVHAVLEQGELTAKGMQVRANQAGAGNAYRAEIDGGTVLLPFPQAPEFRLERARLRYQNGQAYLTSFQVGAWGHATIEGTGDLEVKSRQFTFEGDASGLKCEDLLNEDWAKRLTGDVSSSFIAENRAGFPVASGQLEVRNGVLTALPMLDALAAYADTRRFRQLTLNDVRTHWQWKKGEVAFSDLVLSSEGLVRLEGSLVIRGRNLDGMFSLGIAPGILASIPGAETDVFLPGERGLLWTPLRVSGTLDDPKEDLTERLIMAAGIRMFENLPESGEKVIKFTHSLLGDHSAKRIEKGVKIIEEGSRTVREVSGLLDQILGSGRRDEPESKDEP
jgi:hypothetical protein